MRADAHRRAPCTAASAGRSWQLHVWLAAQLEEHRVEPNSGLGEAIDADHHTEDWTYMTPADQPVQAHIDLVRAK